MINPVEKRTQKDKNKKHGEEKKNEMGPKVT